MSETGCSATLEVDEELRAALDRLPGETYSIEDNYRCDLMIADHDELHHAVAQGAEDPASGTEMWIRWSDDSAPEVIELPDCSSSHAGELCLLFAGHSARHTSGASTWV